MRKFLIATHGNFAEGIKNSLEIIMGKQDNVYTICAYVDETVDLKEQVDNFFKTLEDDDELIIITDIFGGSVNNEFMIRTNNEKVHLISGLNLSLLLELISNDGEIKSCIENAISNSKEMIQYCNKSISNGIDFDDNF